MSEVLDHPEVEVTQTASASCVIAEYNPVAAALATLQAKYKNTVFDVTTTKGMDAAKVARAEVKGYRTKLETIRKQIKAPHLERGRAIDAEAAAITAALSALEEPIDAEIKARESQIEAEKAAKFAAELARVAEIRTRIDQITDVAQRAVGKPSMDVQTKIIMVTGLAMDEAHYGELLPLAIQARESTLYKLGEILTERKAVEAEQERIKAEREELEQLRKAQAAQREKDEAEAKARREAEERAQQEAAAAAEAERQAELAAMRREQEAEAARMAAEREAERKAQAERDRIAREAHEAEQRKLDVERAELKRQQDELAEQQRAQAAESARQQREAQAAEELDRREAMALEDAQRAARQASEDKVRNAAPVLLEALLKLRDLVPLDLQPIVDDACKVAGVNPATEQSFEGVRDRLMEAHSRSELKREAENIQHVVGITNQERLGGVFKKRFDELKGKK